MLRTRLFTNISTDGDGHLDQLGGFTSPQDPSEFLALGGELGGHLGVVLHLDDVSDMAPSANEQ
jgi:hypothetical protein